MTQVCHESNRSTDGDHIEAILSQYDQYLVKQVQECMRLHPGVVNTELIDLETDELIQRVRIKFWHALQDKHIEYPKTYLKRIVNSEFIDLVRRIKPYYTLDLPLDEKGELDQGHMLITPSVGMADPALEYEEQVEAAEQMQKVVDMVLALPSRQQHALICDMRDRVDDLEALKKAFKMRKADIDTLQWPQQKQEKLLLRASLAYARMKVDAHLKETRPGQQLSQGSEGSRRFPFPQPQPTLHRKGFTCLEQIDCQDEPTLESVNGEEENEEKEDEKVVASEEALIHRLPEPYRTAVLLHCHEKWSYPKIASRLDAPLGTVKSHVSRGKKLLSQYGKQQEMKDESPQAQKKRMEDERRTAEITRHLDRLQDPYRKAIALHYLEKQSYPEIAAQLHLPIGTVKCHVSRGMKMLLSI